jgi:hypothetical protein
MNLRIEVRDAKTPGECAIAFCRNPATLEFHFSGDGFPKDLVIQSCPACRSTILLRAFQERAATHR